VAAPPPAPARFYAIAAGTHTIGARYGIGPEILSGLAHRISSGVRFSPIRMHFGDDNHFVFQNHGFVCKHRPMRERQLPSTQACPGGYRLFGGCGFSLAGGQLCVRLPTSSRAPRRRQSGRLHFFPQFQQVYYTCISLHIPEGHPIAENVVRDDFFLAARSDDDLSFLGKTFSAFYIELVLIPQGTHQPTAGAGDLRRVQ
jgi:hypothetical protein